MKLIVILFAIANTALAFDSLLISGFNPFGGAKENNSRILGKKLVEKLSKKFPNKEIKFCEIATVYHKATEEILDCASSMTNRPKMIISLGQAGCSKARLETRAYNLLDNVTPDNDGVVYSERVIDEERSKYFSRNLYWNEAFCDLSSNDKEHLGVSRSAGSFVCNETLYNMSQMQDIAYGFIHVPSASCTDLDQPLLNNTFNAINGLISNLIKINKIQVISYPLSRAKTRREIERTRNRCDLKFLKKIRSN